MKKCALYARVSSSEQAKSYSIDAQLDAGRNYAATQGWPVVEEYVDPGISGTTDERPQFKRMVRAALSGQFEVIIVHAFDRFSRNLEDAVVYKSLLRRDGVQVVSVTEYIDDSPLGFIHEGIIDLFAAYYSINLSVKIHSGFVKALQSGRWPWAVPIGYKRVRGECAQITETGAKIQMAFREFATGKYTLDTWAEAAYQAGLRGPDGNKIRGSGWSRIFHNRFYIGRLVWNDIDEPGIHEPLIDEETFNRVQDILREHDRFSSGRKHSFYLLSGLCWSVDTDCAMSGARAKSGNNCYRYYRGHLKGGPSKHYVPAEVLESQIEQVLSGISIASQDVDKLDVDNTMKLALRVAPNLFSIFQCLDTDKQRQSFLKLVISRYGLKVFGHQIIEVRLKAPFSLILDFMEIARVEHDSCYFFVSYSYENC